MDLRGLLFNHFLVKKFNTIEEAITAISTGEMVVVLDDEDRENEGDLVMAAEMIRPKDVNFMAKEGRGLICVPLSDEIADRLDFHPMVVRNTESTKCNFTVSVDYLHGTSTGISASDRAKTIQAIADGTSVATDFARPGHIFPLRARDGGVLVRAGHTEASVDLARLAGLKSVAVLCEISRDDGEMMRCEELLAFAEEHDLKVITIKDLIEYRRRSEKLVELKAETVLPTDFGDFKMQVYGNSLNRDEHVVLSMGEWSMDDEVLVRVHSECLTGEVFHSMKCDCGAQLDDAMRQVAEKGQGVILYLRNQEGRGIGLVNKVKAYQLQSEGLDTVEANEKLGFDPDLREYGIGAQILVDLGLHKLRLLTNNPTKIVALEGYDLEVVERVPLEVGKNEVNKGYLAVKKSKMGHLLTD